MASHRTWAPPPDAAETQNVAEHVTVEVLGVPDARQPTVSGAIRAGFSFRAFTRLAKTLGVGHIALAGLLGISAGVLARRRARGRFSPYESDRMWMFLRLYLRALEVHGSEAAARAWLSAPLPALGRRSALEVSTNSAGAQRALEVLNQLQYGVFG